jgi:RNA polymerase sigma factor (sigma-70 family)
MESVELTAVVRRVARAQRLDADEAADVEQEVLIALWRRAPDEEVSAGWIAVVAHHKCVDVHRQRSRWRQQDRTLGSLLRPFVPSPELALLVRAEADRLTPREREFFELRYAMGLTEREVGVLLGLCRASVRWKDRTCRRRLGA